MDIAISEHIVRVVVITLGGRVDAFNSPALRAEADRLLAEGVTHFVIDLSAVPFMDSAGMAVLDVVRCAGTCAPPRPVQCAGDARCCGTRAQRCYAPRARLFKRRASFSGPCATGRGRRARSRFR